MTDGMMPDVGNKDLQVAWKGVQQFPSPSCAHRVRPAGHEILDPRQRILSEARGVRVKFPISRVEWFPRHSRGSLIKVTLFPVSSCNTSSAKNVPWLLFFPHLLKPIAAYPQNRPKDHIVLKDYGDFVVVAGILLNLGQAFAGGGSQTHARALEFAQCSSCTRTRTLVVFSLNWDSCIPDPSSRTRHACSVTVLTVRISPGATTLPTRSSVPSARIHNNSTGFDQRF